MAECLFCKMVAGEIKPAVVYETAQILAFRDIHPQAPVHVLIIPKQHIPTLNELPDAGAGLAAELLAAATAVARQEGLAEDGYRLVINCRENGGQEVYHLHAHLLGGRRLRWPPG